MLGAEELFTVQKINSFILNSITIEDSNNLKLRVTINAKSQQFTVGFTDEHNSLGFNFPENLEMMCRANDVLLVRSLMKHLKTYIITKEISTPLVVYASKIELQNA
jgi:hypothetical protein